MRLLFKTAAAVVLSVVVGCSHAPPPAAHSAPAPSNASLYTRLGGKPAIEAVVGDFLNNVAGDSRINARFLLTDIGDLKTKLVDQVCQATGGPCVYKGRDMKTVHQHMAVTNAEFGALVEDLSKSLDTFKVPAREKGELLGALGGMQKDIVGAP
jgi:hemoglobin